MKEEEFEKKLDEVTFGFSKIVIPVYYSLDEEDNVIIDQDEMNAEFEIKLNDILDILK